MGSLVKQVSVFDLASAGKTKHYRAVLTANLYYVLRKNGVPELVGENEFKSASTGFPEFPTRSEVFTLLWYSDPEDPYSWVGDEFLGCRSTQVVYEPGAEPCDIIEAIKKGCAEFTGTFPEDNKFYRKIRDGLTARVTLLENSGHKVTLDASGRIKFKNDRMLVTSIDGATIRLYSPERNSFIKKLKSNEEAYRIIKKESSD
ncbi:MAG: hypothetical protein QXT19_02645 [Candidatus Woesearchaeota archaeon]